MTRILFVGGSGHHSLRRLRDEGRSITAAFCPDPTDLDASRRWRETLGEAEDHAEIEAALDRFQPELVSVGAVYGENSRHALAALRRGLPVVSDKPVAASEEALAALEEAVSTPGARLLTEFDFRARPAIRALRDAIVAGRLGDPCLYVVQKSYRWGTRPDWYADRERYTGTVLWIASHGLDAVRFLGGEVRRCAGVGGNLSRPAWPTMEDHTATLLELRSGASAVVHADLLRPAAAPTHGDDRLRVIGSKGLVEIVEDRAWITTDDAPRQELPTPETPSFPALLWSAALEERHPDFNTDESLRTARLLLDCRRAQDEAAWIE